jgi:predicted transcriptional regulator
MAPTLLEMTTDLTRTLVETGHLSAEDMRDALQSTYALFATLKAQEEAGTRTPLPDAPTPPVDWRQSLTRQTVTCLECGDTFKQLSNRHLKIHGLDTRSYRTKYGIPRTQPLAARTTTERRRLIAQETRPWEQAPRYHKGQARDGTASPEPEAEAIHEAAAKPDTGVPPQPKRQRKTMPKKTARKQPM